ASDLTRADRRETLRLAVFLCSTPFCALRASSGAALFSASAAAVLSPEAIASSTLRTAERARVVRALLICVRFSVWRAAFFAELVLAILLVSLYVCPVAPWPRRRPCGSGFSNALTARNTELRAV